jgi:potassium-transporting ATPase KdpC subunit
MRRDLLTSVIAIVALTLIFGVAYPLVVTGVAKIAFPGRADGSMVSAHGHDVGSRLIGQDFKGLPRYFQSRPSTATDYNAAATAFTNLGPNSKDARKTFATSLAAYLRLERPYDRGLTAAQVPIDAVTSSASGIDPQISVANARIQAHRVAAVRRLPMSTVDRLISDTTAGRFLGVLGEPAVNVLDLNLALDRLSAR